MKRLLEWILGRRVRIIRGRNGGYSSRWYEVKDGYISIKKGESKGVVVDMEDC